MLPSCCTLLIIYARFCWSAFTVVRQTAWRPLAVSSLTLCSSFFLFINVLFTSVIFTVTKIITHVSKVTPKQ